MESIRSWIRNFVKSYGISRSTTRGGGRIFIINTADTPNGFFNRRVLFRFVVSTDAESMTAAANSLDLILNTVSANHDLSHYLPLLVGRCSGRIKRS
jgi:hypothetical protein